MEGDNEVDPERINIKDRLLHDIAYPIKFKISTLLFCCFSLLLYKPSTFSQFFQAPLATACYIVLERGYHQTRNS